MKIIDDMESDGRTAAQLVTFRLMEVHIRDPIRTLFANGSRAYVQTCGGNVYDSNPEDEYEEIRRKFAGTKKS